MNSKTLFCHISTACLEEIINNAQDKVCYIGPGIQKKPALALVKATKRLGVKNISLWIDFDERVMRMGYGDIEAVKILRDAHVEIKNVQDLRSAIIIADGEGYTYTPTPLFLEAEPGNNVHNALRLYSKQVEEILARISSDATDIASTNNPEEKEQINNHSDEWSSQLVNDKQFEEVNKNMQVAPPVKFDIARQVRVFEPYLQYVELSLNGAAIQRQRLSIPLSIQQLGGNKDIEGRLHTTFDLIEKSNKLSSKELDVSLNEIRKNFTKSLGKDQGRVILKGVKPHFEKRLLELKGKLEKHQEKVKQNLHEHLEKSCQQIVKHYLPLVTKKPPDALVGTVLSGKPNNSDAERWLEFELAKVFPKAEDLISKMTLEERYKDVTYETLKHADFLESIKKAYPDLTKTWDNVYSEFNAIKEKNT